MSNIHKTYYAEPKSFTDDKGYTDDMNQSESKRRS